MITRCLSIALSLACLYLASSCAEADIRDDMKLLKVPKGFSIDIYVEGVRNARSMTLSPNGTLFVGTRTAGKVYAIVDEDKDYRADKVYTLLDKNVLPDGTTLKMPNGVAFKDGALYVGALGHVLRLDNIESRLADPPAPVIVSHQHPDKQHHGWKFIAFGPDGKLYVPVGAPCNVCEREDIFASITRMNADGSELEIV
ncbi:MAG: sorbosone dehydrogenase family protein, partial [Candidatus Hydrogenedentes bacterium]|nr:sorbosone dehydrogenase family protein [Candidatus Hydrogenedentota bacterium]